MFLRFFEKIISKNVHFAGKAIKNEVKMTLRLQKNSYLQRSVRSAVRRGERADPTAVRTHGAIRPERSGRERLSCKQRIP